MYVHWSNLTVVCLTLLSNLFHYLKPSNAAYDFKSSLHFKTLSAEHVNGCYAFNKSLGLCFDIRTGQILLTKQRNGENFVRFNDIGRNTFYFQILDHTFVGQNSSLRLVSRDAHKRPHPLHVNMNNSSALNTGTKESQKYLEEIAEMLHKAPESLLLKDLSSAFATGNVSSFRTLHSLYLMSIGLTHLTKQDLRLSYRSETQVLSQKMAALTDRFDTSGSCQVLSHDPYKNNCLGMCGPGCVCWNFICKDCCFHEGCRQHDVCCRHQALSTFCLTPFIYHFTCNGFGGYPKCLQ